jgi:hypothetical protein
MEQIMDCLLIKIGTKLLEEIRMIQEDGYPANQNRSKP